MMLFIHSVSHFLVDALSITILFHEGADANLLAIAVVLYNTLAFSTQCLVGLLLDEVKRTRFFTAASMLTIILGFIMPLPFLCRVAVAAAGNSFFHVSAGKMTLLTSENSARNLGIFVAPGAIGVTLGTCFPRFGWPLCAAMLICAAIICFSKHFDCVTHKDLPGYSVSAQKSEFPLLPVMLLCCAVAVRAVGGSVIDFPWKQGIPLAFLLTGFVFLGKFLGGFVCDKFGPTRTAWFTVPLAAVFLCFFSQFMFPSLIGQLLLNLTMPLTLWLLYKLMPEAPAFAFGLAASALWPGTVAGLLFQLTGPWAKLCAACCFALSLISIIYAANFLKRKEISGT